MEEYALRFSREGVTLTPCKLEAIRRKLDLAGELAEVSCPISFKIKNKIKGMNVFDDKTAVTIFLCSDQKDMVLHIDGIIEKLYRKKELRIHQNIPRAT